MHQALIHLDAQFEMHTLFEQHPVTAIQYGFVEFKRRHPCIKQAANGVLPIINRDLAARPVQLIGAGQTRRPGADNHNRFIFSP